LIALTTELKKDLMYKLFTEGTCGEPQKQTEIGLIPESWQVIPLGDCCDIANSRISYTELTRLDSSTSNEAADVMGVKVSDMNLPGNEEAFVDANLIRRLSPELAKKKTIPPGAIVFPKRGAAIATNKKRVTTTWTVLDPNLIAVVPGERVIPGYLYYWSQIFDLRKITDPGPTPQLNKKDVAPVPFPLPQKPDEQDEITNALETIDKSLCGYRQRLSVMRDLFRTLLHKLMAAEIRVNDLDLAELGIEVDEEQAEAD
jgi:type I restriction enzyme S subunit